MPKAKKMEVATEIVEEGKNLLDTITQRIKKLIEI
jgi:hypothetical protein